MRLPISYKFVVALLGPILWSILFVTIAGVLSIPHQSFVTPGKFKRRIGDCGYFHRRLYGLCWTAVYYNKPVYFLCLSIPILKWLTFRLFGYRGSMNFTIYPDTWIRDLPLLHFEDGVYVSNRATLGTNIALSNGFLLVDRITLRSKSLVGHLTMLAPGVEMQHGAEVGVGGAIGIGTKIGRNASVGPRCSIGHGVLLGNRATVGGHSCVDSGSILADGIRLPVGSVVVRRKNTRNAAMKSSVSENERLAIMTADEGAAI
jgi:acetyltransferase-like isoleucine patch superfamily enzyme